MSLFDKWKKKDASSKMTEGWDAIVEACEKVYPRSKRTFALWNISELEIGWQ